MTNIVRANAGNQF